MFKRCRCSLTCSEYFSNALINGLVTSSLERANAVKEKFCRFGETQESCGNNYGYRVFSLETTSHSSQLRKIAIQFSHSCFLIKGIFC